MRLEPLGKAQMPKNPEAKFAIWDSRYLPLAAMLAVILVGQLVRRQTAGTPLVTELVVVVVSYLTFFVFIHLLDQRHRYAIDSGVFYHRNMHSKRSLELANVRRAEIFEGTLEFELVSGETERFEFPKSAHEAEEKTKFLEHLEASLPVPLQKEKFLKDLVSGVGDNSKTLVPAEWQEKMRLSAGEEVSRFPIKETWSVVFGRKLTPLPITLFILTCVVFPILTTKQVPAVAYLALLIPLAIATWLIVKKQVPTLDLVIGQDGLGVALGETFIFGEPYSQIKAFTFKASESPAKKSSYWFQIETAHGTKITEEILVESPSSTKDLFFVKGQLPLREENAEADPRSAPKPWEPYLPAPNNTPRTK